MGWLSDIVDIARTGFGIYEALTDKGEDEAERRSEQAFGSLQEALELAKAASDPTSPRFQNLAALLAEAERGDLVSVIDAQMRSRRRAAARGLGPSVVEAERGPEARTRALAQGYAAAERNARALASQMLAQAAGGVRGVGGTMGGMVGLPMDIEGARAARRGGLWEGLADLGDIFAGWYEGRDRGGGGDEIIWNSPRWQQPMAPTPLWKQPWLFSTDFGRDGWSRY